MRTFLIGLKINQKLIIMFLSISLILIITGFVALQVSFSIYEEQLYRQAAEFLILLSEMVDIRLNKIEQISFDILSSKEVQEYLAIVRRDGNSYNQYEVLNNFDKKMLTWFFNENYISSVNVVDIKNNQYSWGRNTVRIDPKRLEFIWKQAIRRKGGMVWIGPSDFDHFVVAARMVRSIPNLELENLGLIVIRIDPEKLFNNFSNRKLTSEDELNFVILSTDGVVIYQKDNHQFLFNELIYRMNKKMGYFIDNIQGEKYLITYVTSQWTNWKFVNLLPYTSIFKNIIAVHTILVLVYVGVFVLVVYLSFLFSRGITKPFKRLTNKMKMVEKGEFEKIAQMGVSIKKQGDEIAELEYNFHLMVDKINTLIKENYLKQIAIKESQFKALQAQINPHFLYNTLDSINWMARFNKQYQIASMVKALGSLLRNSISNKSEIISLKEEMKILEDYIIIQKYRYGERLKFSMDIPQDYWECMIPKLSLQPIVENSIQYGLEKIVGVCEIKVWIEPLEKELKIWIEDNGPGMDKDFVEKLNRGEIESRGSGIGIKNINERIKIIFGLEYGVNVSSVLGEGTKVCIFIPCRRSDDFV
ncbi:two-component system sensor histidine kinase YesM [Caldicoprobacter guelmensis]|uniref:cache domain-containing sensor histidine kinase n=1 Tax=Caldicoprobacter guelmensis TaxID=1170224 RepID=UPI00195EB0E5|nr:sensor histidine kinase [Caldicoprobacter guelmensis]MBM7582215.1 two-component system sensor histidine kinase YesM [Caldicoprobacter guelmensis]